jgi:hypothetical protein
MRPATDTSSPTPYYCDETESKGDVQCCVHITCGENSTGVCMSQEQCQEGSWEQSTDCTVNGATLEGFQCCAPATAGAWVDGKEWEASIM